MRALSILLASCLAAACATRSVEPVPALVSADDFVGAWQSVTPSFEFVRLTIVSKSSAVGVLGARLTFSGVAWEGQGSIDRDSLLAVMTVAGSAQGSGAIVAHRRDARTLTLQVRPTGATPIDLTLVRQE